ncbi:efflux RND transporter permease subunit [Chengkuizengella axinellae]|uniref:Efflux RND transporter permease subunit n=1 Tax=Chengkuizengella axinellae TaxID=3064388 RepID=A0ABT9ITM5_9BACL|nr:efflux RND transporter permease subunit [Chengkuizengella sp. 2205SS18-9]MDP5272688.1 efflux RND transporter permease subunit [Chengkuizengella sp. 2205SS18-9]
MNFLTSFSLKNPFAILIICILLIGGGIFSFFTLKSDLLPDIEFPELSVTTVYPGASSQDVNTYVTSVLETQLSSLTGLEQMTSQSMESVSRIQLTFPIDTDMEIVIKNVNEKISNTQLPEGTTTNVDLFSFGSLPVVNLALFPKQNEDISDWALNVLRTELLKINGINSVALSSVPQEYLGIVVDKQLASAQGIGLQQIKEEIQTSFLSFPAGTIQNDAVIVPVRVDQKLETKNDLNNLLISSPITNELIPLSEIAELEEVVQQNEISRYNLQNSVSLLINKKQDANTVEVAEQFYEVLQRYEDKINYAVVFDQSDEIQSSISELVNKGIWGAIFASIAVLIFLRNIRATIIAVVSIPLSLLVGIIFLKWFNYTLNTMSLAGLAVAVGRVVDDSIIVIENIYRKIRMEPEKDRFHLTISGTREMINPIISSTLASIVVFMPLGLVGGITGAFFMPFAVAVVVSLLASLVVAITLIPVLARFSFVTLKEHKNEPFYVRWYGRSLHYLLNKKVIVISLSLLLLISSLLFVPTLGFVFLPNEKEKMLVAEVTLPTSNVIESTDEISLAVEKELLNHKEKYPSVFVSIGNYDYMTSTSLVNRAQYFIELEEEMDVDKSIQDIKEIMESIVLKKNEEATISVQELQSGGPPTQNNVDVDLFSINQNQLLKASKQVEEMLLNRSDLKYVKNNMSEKQNQVSIKLNVNKLDEYGLSSFMILGAISDQTGTAEVGSYKLDGIEQDIKIEYNQLLTGIEELQNITFFSQVGPVQLKEIAEIEVQEVVTSIQKLDEQIYAKVTALATANNIATVTQEVKKVIQEMDFPDGVTVKVGGGNDETVEVLIDILVAIVIAIGLVYITMLVFFGKARLPFVILTSILFIPIGAIVGLVLVKEPLSMSAMIGFLMLVGIVVTNAIVLVDRINQNRKNGLSIRDSVIDAGKTRIRPILMTAFATIAALLPLAFATPEGGLISRGLAVVVIGGLTTSTFLTLVFLPVIYELSFYRTFKREQDGRI